PRSVPWVAPGRQGPKRWKCRYVKGFWGTGRPAGRPTRIDPRSLERTSDRKTLPAAALTLDVRVAEAEGLVQPLLHEVHDRPVDQREACAIDEDPYAAVLEHRIAGLRAVGVVDDVREAGAAGLADAEPQADAVPTGCQESLDPKGCGFRQ